MQESTSQHKHSYLVAHHLHRGAVSNGPSVVRLLVLTPLRNLQQHSFIITRHRLDSETGGVSLNVRTEMKTLEGLCLSPVALLVSSLFPTLAASLNCICWWCEQVPRHDDLLGLLAS